MPPGSWKSRVNTRWRYVPSALSTWKRKRESTKGGTDKRDVYNRLFTKILDSSIWLEDVTTRIVWITLLAAMDEDGYAHFSAVENLALRARVSIKEAEFALQRLMSPDSNSENPAYEGRRVERVAGGFLVLNAAEHRKTLNREIRREQTRLRVTRHREKQERNDASVTGALQSVTSASACTRASASANEKGSPEGKQKSLREELMDSLSELLSPNEMAKNGGLWRQRINECPQAVAFAIEDYKVRTPNQRNTIRNLPAWLTDRHKRVFKELNP